MLTLLHRRKRLLLGPVSFVSLKTLTSFSRVHAASLIFFPTFGVPQTNMGRWTACWKVCLLSNNEEHGTDLKVVFSRRNTFCEFVEVWSKACFFGLIFHQPLSTATTRRFICPCTTTSCTSDGRSLACSPSDSLSQPEPKVPLLISVALSFFLSSFF